MKITAFIACVLISMPALSQKVWNFSPSPGQDVDAFSYGCDIIVNTTADATPCLQAAANAASLTKDRRLHIPGGTYQIRTRWNCPANGVVMVGDGWSITQAGVGTWLHVVTSQFASGGPQFGNHPFQCGSSAAVNMLWVDSIAFNEDQPADTGGWTPTSYGSMWIFSNGSIAPRFTNDYFAGVNYALNFHSVNGFYLENNYYQVYSTGVQVDHNADFAHVAHEHFNDFFCTVTNCPNITAYIQANAVAYQSNRNDTPTWVDVQAFGIQTLFAFGTDATGVTTEYTISGADCDKCQQTMLVSAVGVNGKAYGLLGHGNNFAGNASLSNSNLINIAATSTSDVLQFSDLRCEVMGDSCITDLGSSNTVVLGGSLYASSWGSNSTNGACGTIYALASNNTANSNQILGNPNAWVFSTGCSSLTFSAVTPGPLFATSISAGAGGFTVTSSGQITSTAILTVPKITLSGASCSSVGVGICPGTSNTLNFIAGSTNSGIIDLHQHWSIGSSASPSIASGACGTGTNGTISGNDHSGLITIASASTSSCTVTFSASFTTAPHGLHLEPASSATSGVAHYTSALGTSGFTFNGTLASTSWYYWVQ